MLKFRFIIFLIVTIPFLCSCKKNSDPEPLPTFNVIYQVVGDCESVFITYENKDGGTNQISGASVPWSFRLENKPKGTWVYLSAQNEHEDGSFKVQIYRDLELLWEGEAQGAYAIATVSGRI